MEGTAPHRVIVAIEEWYGRAPEGLDDNGAIRWVQRNALIPCPACGDLLFVLRTRNAGDRGFSHLALCQNPDCTFQVAD